MVRMLVGLAIYLSVLAGLGKSLRNVDIKTKRIVGYVATAPPLILLFNSLYRSPLPPLFSVDYFVCVWYAVCAVLGYFTVAHAPKWIVGEAKPSIEVKK